MRGVARSRADNRMAGIWPRSRCYVAVESGPQGNVLSLNDRKLVWVRAYEVSLLSDKVPITVIFTITANTAGSRNPVTRPGKRPRSDRFAWSPLLLRLARTISSQVHCCGSQCGQSCLPSARVGHPFRNIACVRSVLISGAGLPDRVRHLAGAAGHQAQGNVQKWC